MEDFETEKAKFEYDLRNAILDDIDGIWKIREFVQQKKHPFAEQGESVRAFINQRESIALWTRS